MATIDSPERFATASGLGAYLGLTPRTYESGEVDRIGRISKCIDSMLRGSLSEAAHALLTRVRQNVNSKPGHWPLQDQAREGEVGSRASWLSLCIAGSKKVSDDCPVPQNEERLGKRKQALPDAPFRGITNRNSSRR
ncbi:MAG: IS110 family transposase [Acidobacteriaceae bacterium]|nr:IS110 family transposase [Acidobacteriaceae bacterium]